MMTACFHRDHSRLMATQKILSNRLRPGRGRRRFSTVNSCRSTKFSKMRSWRLRKIRRSNPTASHRRTFLLVPASKKPDDGRQFNVGDRV